jgi:hypothetical protein
MILQLSPQKSQLELDLESINEPLIRIENRTKANVHDLNESIDKFWSLPDDRLLNILNILGPEKAQNIFNAQDSYAESFNSLLNDRGITNILAKIGTQKELTINNQGLFELVMPQTIDQFILPEEIIIEQLV